jgi:hypothetical protein
MAEAQAKFYGTHCHHRLNQKRQGPSEPLAWALKYVPLLFYNKLIVAGLRIELIYRTQIVCAEQD